MMSKRDIVNDGEKEGWMERGGMEREVEHGSLEIDHEKKKECG